MLQTNIQKYMNFPLISNIAKFADSYYGSVHEMERVTNFPQQTNGYDCGMMMLCGIKDVVRNYRTWSFSQNDINYKRVLLTHELLEHQMTGF
jgi:Ulp1 family protease